MLFFLNEDERNDFYKILEGLNVFFLKFSINDYS